MKICKLCEGSLYLLGILGNIAWFRCRHCGVEFSENVGDAIEWEEEGGESGNY